MTAPKPAGKNENALKMKPKPIQANSNGTRPGKGSDSAIQRPSMSKHDAKVLLLDLLKNRPENWEVSALTKWNLRKEELLAKITMHEIVDERRK